jgi:hypothetical protein
MFILSVPEIGTVLVHILKGMMITPGSLYEVLINRSHAPTCAAKVMTTWSTRESGGHVRRSRRHQVLKTPTALTRTLQAI